MEKLLELAEDEENGDGQADALELRPVAAPAPPPPEMETQAGPRREETAEAAAPAEVGDLPAGLKIPVGTAETTALPEHPGEAPGVGERLEGGGLERSPADSIPAEARRGGQGHIVAGPNGTALLRWPGAGDVELARTDAPAGRTAQDGPAAPPQPARRGLEALYRQAAQAARPAPQAQAALRPGQEVRLGEPDTPRQLTVDELDRALRRDSRRYDGGLEIF